MPSILTDVNSLELLTDRWLIEALSVMSSNPHVRGPATAWLDAYSSALRLGCAEREAQARADDAFQKGVGQDRLHALEECPRPAPSRRKSGERTHG